MMNNMSYDSDDDPFASNPFRTNNNDLLDAPPSNPAGANRNGIMMNQPLNQPDPNSGMTGSFDLNDLYSQGQTRNVQPQQQAPSQYLTGSMDMNNGTRGGLGRGPVPQQANYGGTADVPSTPPSRFAWCTSCLKLDSYKQYFDMDTIDVLKRLKASVTQFHQPDQFRTAVVGDEPNADAELKGPDLYGPLWVSATLVFMIGVTSNINAYFHHRAKQHSKSSSGENSDESATPTIVDEEFEADLHHLLRAGSVVAFFAFVVPAAFWITSSCMGMPVIRWAMWTCCYGYAQTPFLLATLVAWLPFELITWIVLGCAGGASFLLVVRNLSTPLLSQDTAGQAKSAPILLAILCLHFIYVMILKITFYR